MVLRGSPRLPPAPGNFSKPLSVTLKSRLGLLLIYECFTALVLIGRIAEAYFFLAKELWGNQSP